MRIRNPGFGNELPYEGGHIRNGLYTVIHIENLTAPCKFAADRLADQFLIILHDKCLYRYPVLRGLFKNAHVPYPYKTHMKRSRYGCCGKRQDIDTFLHLLDLFLVGYPEPLFLVDYKKSQILERHIL